MYVELRRHDDVVYVELRRYDDVVYVELWRHDNLAASWGHDPTDHDDVATSNDADDHCSYDDGAVHAAGGEATGKEAGKARSQAGVHAAGS